MTSWSTETQQGHEALHEIREWWDRQSDARNNPLLNSALLATWHDGLEEPKSEFFLHVLLRDGDIVAALPVYKSGLRYRTLLRAYASAMNVVSIPDPDVAAYLPKWIGQMEVAHLYRFPDDSPIVQAMGEHERWSLQARLASPYIDLQGGMERVRSEWSKSFRKGLSRRWRRLQEMGTVEYVNHHSPTEISAALSSGLELEARGWKGRDGVAVLSQPGYEAWFRSVAEVANHHGWLRLSAIYLNDRMIAFCFDLEYAGRRHSLVSAYDEADDVARLSPGNALVNAALEEGVAAGLETYELGYGDQTWKYDWTTRQRYVNDILVVGSGIRATYYSLARRARAITRPRSDG